MVGRRWLAGLVALTAALVPLGPGVAGAASMVTVTSCDEGHLRSAISSAAAGGAVHFACSGTITLTADMGGPLTLGKSLTIDGGGQEVTISGGGSLQVFVIEGGVHATLHNLTISDGVAPGFGAGGGIDNAGTLVVADSTLSGNRAVNGGGIANEGGGSLTVSDSTFSGNSAETGAGIENSGTLVVTNSTLSGNHAFKGAGIANAGTATVAGSTFSGNRASGGGGTGGGIFNNFGTLVVAGSTFSGNSATEGGGICNNFGTTTITGSTFFGNSAPLGGGILSLGGTVAVSGSTFSDNRALNGGGVDNLGSGTVTLANTILAGAISGGECAGPIADAGGNLADDGSCSFTQASSANNSPTLAASLGPLADNGGPTQTIALLPGSPATGAGLVAACITDPVNGVDQRGLPRFASLRGACDSGAYDSGAGLVPPLTLTGAIPLTAGVPARLGFAVSNHATTYAGVAGLSPFNIGYITFQQAANTFTVRRPSVACSNPDHCFGTTGLVNGAPGFVLVPPGMATLTLSGPISSGRGAYAQGAIAAVTLDLSASAAGVVTVSNVTVAVAGVNGGSPVATWAALPAGTNIHLDTSAPLIL